MGLALLGERVMSANATLLLPESSGRKGLIVIAAQKHTLFMIRMALLLLTFIGAVAYNDYGSPGGWFSDELTGVTAGMLVNRDLNPHSFAYPAGLQIYGTFILYRLLHIFSHHPAVINMFLLNGVARTLSAVFFVSGVALFERSVACLGRRRQDFFALVVFATSCAMIHHAHIGTVQSSLFFAVALVTYSTARCIIVRNLKYYYFAVFCCGVAIGTKYTGIYLQFVCLSSTSGPSGRPDLLISSPLLS